MKPICPLCGRLMDQHVVRIEGEMVTGWDCPISKPAGKILGYKVDNKLYHPEQVVVVREYGEVTRGRSFEEVRTSQDR